MPTQFFNSPLFETIICLVLIYALLSLLVSTLGEIVNSYFNERGLLLYKTVSKLFDDNINVNFGQLLYNHPMISNLRKDLHSLPQYISDTMFSQVLVEVIGNYARVYSFVEDAKKIMPVEGPADPFDRFIAGVASMKHTPLKLMLQQMADKSASASEKAFERLPNLEKQIQQWYNDQMDRASGWFKDFMRQKLVWISFLVAISLNVDSIGLFTSLYGSPTLRQQLIAASEKVADNYAKEKADTTLTALQQQTKAVALSNLRKNPADTAILRVALTQLQQLDRLANQQDSMTRANIQHAQDQLDEIQGMGLPVGWHQGILPLTLSKNHRGTFTNLLLYILGIIITALSISSGAPFWFDMLLKFVNIRRAGKKPEQTV